MSTPDNPVARTWEIAVQSLRSNYREAEGPDRSERTFIVAGPRIYQHVHGRDFPYAASGALVLGDFKPVRDTLATFLDFQRKDGLLPRALAPWPPYVASTLETLGLKLDFKDRIKPNYISEGFVHNTDPNSLLVWTALRFAKASGDWGFIGRRYEALSRAMLWYESRKRDNLVFQVPYSDWQDTVKRKGRVFYTNLCWWKGLVSLAEIAKQLGQQEEKHWRFLAESAKSAIHSFFWDKDQGFFRNTEKLGSFETGANLLAIIWDFAAPRESQRILETVLSPKVWQKLGPKATVPDYPLFRKSAQVVFSGFAGYHDRMIWSWHVALVGAALRKMNRKDEALARMLPMAETILKDGSVGEVYKGNGQVKTWLWRSESPFSWAAGMWLEALAGLGFQPGLPLSA